MKLDFNILWFDDQPDKVESAKERLRKKLLREGFELNVQMISNFSGIEKTIREAYHEGDIDLILIDYHLGAGSENIKDGDDLAKKVRQRFRYKEIIFYSSLEAGLPKLRRLMCDAGIDGAFCVARGTNIADEIHEVIQTIIKKAIDIDHMRGIVMAATSDMDHAIAECLRTAYNNLGASDQMDKCKSIVSSLQRNLQASLKKVDRVIASPDIDSLFGLHPSIFTSASKYRALLKVLNDWEKDHTHSDKHSLLKKYEEEVVRPRNTLAHIQAINDGKRKTLLGSDGVEITDQSMAALRSKLLKHRKNLNEIASALGLSQE